MFHTLTSILLLCSSLLLLSFSSAQAQKSLDSAKAKADTTEARTLLLQMNQHINFGIGYSQALDKGIESKRLFTGVIGEKNCIVGYLTRQIGMLLVRLNRFHEAIDTLNDALLVYDNLQCGKRSHKATVYHNLSLAYWNSGDLGKSLTSAQMSIHLDSIAFGTARHETMVSSYNNLGDIQSQLGHFQEALNSNRLAEEVLKETNAKDKETLGEIYYNRGVIYMRVGQLEEADTYFQKAIKLLNKASLEGKVNMGMVLLGRAYYFMQKGDFEKSLKFGLRAISKIEKGGGDRTTDYAIAYNTVGTAHRLLGNYGVAEEYIVKALQLIQHYPNKKKYYLHHVYNSLGMLAMDRGYGRRAEEYFFLALDNCKNTGLGDLFMLNQLRSNLVQLYQISNNWERALPLIDEILADEKLLQTRPQIAVVYMALGNYQSYLEQYQEAIQYYRKGIAMYANSNHPDVARFYYGIAKVYSLLLKRDKVIEAIDSSKLIITENYHQGHPEVIRMQTLHAIVLVESGEIDQAQKELNNCIKNLGYKPGKSLEEIVYSTHLMDAFSTLAWSFVKRFEVTKQTKDLELADQLYQEYSKILKYFAGTLIYGGEILGQNRSTARCYYNALMSRRTMYLATKDKRYLKEGFEYLERAKASNLLTAFQHVKAVAGLPDTLLEKVKDIRQTMGGLVKQIELKEVTEDADSDLLFRQLQEKRREHKKLTNLLAKGYPKYHKARYELEVYGLDEIQQHLLQEDETLIEYMVGYDSILVFLVQKNHFEVKQIARDPVLLELANEILGGVVGFYRPDVARKVYEILLGPFKDKLTKKLIIAPDVEIGYIPFEMLLTKDPENPIRFDQYDYLIKEKEISYCYSATLLKEMRDKRHLQQPNRDLLAMAPFSTADTLSLSLGQANRGGAVLTGAELPPLPASGQEIATVAKQWDGDAYYGNEATINNFDQYVEDYRIILLATHGEIDGIASDYSFLAFAHPDSANTYQKLYIHDLYNYELNADMVVLSACNSGSGLFKAGEGVISLARAVSYAGGKSAFTTLWSIDDESAKDLVIAFFDLLQRPGMTKSEALRQAKLKFIAANPGPKSNPIYWAAFIGIGDMSPIN